MIVLLGGGVRTALGFGLLGLPFSWAFGSNQKSIHWLFVVLGCLLLIPAIRHGISWPRQRLERLNKQADLVETDHSLVQDEPNVYYEQLRQDEQELQELQRENTYHHIVKTDWPTITGGVLMLSSGVGLLIGLRSVAKSSIADKPPTGLDKPIS
jgi:hypothetical protein